MSQQLAPDSVGEMSPSTGLHLFQRPTSGTWLPPSVFALTRLIDFVMISFVGIETSLSTHFNQCDRTLRWHSPPSTTTPIR